MGQVRSIAARDRPKAVVRCKSKPEKINVALKKLKQGSDEIKNRKINKNITGTVSENLKFTLQNRF
jgi:hypothetical protein